MTERHHVLSLVINLMLVLPAAQALEVDPVVEAKRLEAGYARLCGVWEWTGTEFDGYAGFRAYPYREYSEVFFLKGYRVLRGGSWATAAEIASPTFRNWDLPERRQIFSGVRLAKEI